VRVAAAPEKPTRDRIEGQLEVESRDHARHDPGRSPQYWFDRVLAHPAPVRDEVDQRDHSERELQGEHDLGEHEQFTGRVLAECHDRDHGRDDRNGAVSRRRRSAAAATGRNLHDDLAGQGPGDRGGLTRGDQGNRKGHRRDCGPQERFQQPVGVLNLGDIVETGPKKGRGRHHEQRGVDEEGAVERHHRVDEVVPHAAADSGRVVEMRRDCTSAEWR
jgi:hypothetical protein